MRAEWSWAGLIAAAVAGTAGCGTEVPPEPPPAPGCRDEGVPFTECLARTRVESGPFSWALETGPIVSMSLGDCNEDGLPDLFVTNPLDRARLYKHEGAFVFRDATEGSGLTLMSAQASSLVDLDNDGHLDLVVAMGNDLSVSATPAEAPSREVLRVFRGSGLCTFEERTEAWGFVTVESSGRWTTAGVDVADVNLDGTLDLLVRRIGTESAAPLALYLSRPDGTWAEGAAQLFPGIEASNASNLFFDVDDDGLEDLFIFSDGRRGAPARYFHRTGSLPAAFEEQPFAPALFGNDAAKASLSSGVTGDVDGDGRLDLYVTDLGGQHLFLASRQEVDAAEPVGVALPLVDDGSPAVGSAATMTDFDNDGRPDLAVAFGLRKGFLSPAAPALMHNLGNGTFEDVSAQLGLSGAFHSQTVWSADVDRDGRSDLFLGGEKVSPVLMRNQTDAGKSLAIRLKGHDSNAMGIGARVTVSGRGVSGVQEMRPGGGAWGAGEARLVFGTGASDEANDVTVRWPSGLELSAGTAAAGDELVVEEPEIVWFETAEVAEGGRPVVTVRPVNRTGAPVGPGRSVQVKLVPGDVGLTVTDRRNGRYEATGDVPPGTYAAHVTVDGTLLHIHPQVVVR